MSPKIFIFPFINPIIFPRSVTAAVVAMLCATGFLVILTTSRISSHLALNSEMGFLLRSPSLENALGYRHNRDQLMCSRCANF
jgi:hypothetical protein